MRCSFRFFSIFSFGHIRIFFSRLTNTLHNSHISITFGNECKKKNPLECYSFLFFFKLERKQPIRLCIHTRCQIGRLKIGKWVNKCRFLDISHQFCKTMDIEPLFLQLTEFHTFGKYLQLDSGWYSFMIQFFMWSTTGKMRYYLVHRHASHWFPIFTSLGFCILRYEHRHGTRTRSTIFDWIFIKKTFLQRT